jgi:LPS-assembly lipoprotein
MLNKKLFINILLLITVSACGWQLRDTQLLSADIGAIHLTAQDSHSRLIAELRQGLDNYGISTTSIRAEASYTIVILDSRASRRTSTLNSGGRVAEYQLNEEVDFTIFDQAGNQLTGLVTASVEKVFEFDERDVLASVNEEQLVRNQMHQEIVRQILNHFSRLPIVNAGPR